MTESPLAGVELHLVETIDDAMALKRWLGERHEGLLCVDTESGGLSPWRHRLRTVQFGDMRTGWTVPWERWGGVALEILNAWDGELGAHNGVHDWKFLSVHAGHDIRWELFHDTLTQARIDDPSRPNGLKPRAAADIDKRAISGQQALDEGMAANKWTWDTVPINFPPYWIYAALDPVLTSHLDNKYRPRVMATAPQAYDLERAANRICTKMMMKGMLVDVPYVQRAISAFAKTSEEIRAWLRTAHQITSPASAGEIRRAFERLGQDVLFWTDKGAPQFTKATLGFYHANGQNEAVRQLAQYILAVRRSDKMPRDYLQKFLDLRDSDDILRMTINVMGAITSRMSVSDPPMQQLSRDEKAIRGSFIPRPGHVFISCDLSQIEMRMIADASGDEGLIDAILEADATGTNLFIVIGSEMYGEKITKADPRYSALKAFCYARAYGAGHETLADTAGVPVKQIQHIEELFDTRFPGMRAIMESLEHDAASMRARGERAGVQFPSGRFIPCKPGKDYTALNYRIQGPAAEYMKKSLINIDNAGLGNYLVLPVHDEAVLEVPEGEAEEALKIVEECMTDRGNYRVPLTASGEIMAERWHK
jgi:DNA polymerase I